MSAAADRSGLLVWAVGPAFLGVAAWLFYASPPAGVPRGAVRNAPLAEIAPGAWRQPLRDASQATVNGSARPCSDCHKLFTPSPVENRTLVQHKNVVLHHGMNTRCFNCHHAEQRDSLVLHDGTLVPFAETPRLCSQCHGTVYRDWQNGVHGKTMGSWDAASGKQRRLTCNECHDPHAPAYPKVAPMAGPTTMRMGDQSRPQEHHGKQAPLRRWSTPHDAPHETPEGVPQDAPPPPPAGDPKDAPAGSEPKEGGR